MLEILIELIGYLGGIFIMISFVPQVIKTYKTKNADDVSLQMLLATLIGMIFWIFYGIFIAAVPIIVMNIMFTTTVLLEIYLKSKYSSKR